MQRTKPHIFIAFFIVFHPITPAITSSQQTQLTELELQYPLAVLLPHEPQMSLINCYCFPWFFLLEDGLGAVESSQLNWLSWTFSMLCEVSIRSTPLWRLKLSWGGHGGHKSSKASAVSITQPFKDQAFHVNTRVNRALVETRVSLHIRKLKPICPHENAGESEFDL